uniref:E3 ubiquitin-protein ligase TRIM39-like n=1 Tax=Sinocyclocheilus rhinocerous TaxID=307959 RepID=A0A673MHE0_9TELE
DEEIQLTEYFDLHCSVCLDVFTDPVSTPCGHNFCKSCLNQCWDNSQDCKCPLCKETFSKRPDLKINTALRQVAQLFQKKSSLSKSEVLCDICDERKKKMILDRIKKIQDIKYFKSAERVKAANAGLFSDLMRSIKRCQAELLEMMEEKQKTAEKQDEELIQELQQEITELKMRNTELDHLLHTEDHLQLLQVIYIYSAKHLEIFVKMYSFVKMYYLISLSVDVTLDPDTAHPKLILSNDGKQVRHGDIKHELPDYPERFNYSASVLGKEGFLSGRFYFEVQLKGKSQWDLGVARESINRKGKIRVSPQDGFWAVALRNGNEYWACADPCVYLSLRVKPQKVGVFVDYEEGLVTFYDVESRSQIYSFTAQSFTNRLYSYFCPFSDDTGKDSAPMIISPLRMRG